jgi:hypothetical protein
MVLPAPKTSSETCTQEAQAIKMSSTDNTMSIDDTMWTGNGSWVSYTWHRSTRWTSRGWTPNRAKSQCMMTMPL